MSKTDASRMVKFARDHGCKSRLLIHFCGVSLIGFAPGFEIFYARREPQLGFPARRTIGIFGLEIMW